MNLTYPGNAQVLASTLIEILNLDLVDPDMVNQWIGLNEDDPISQPPPDDSAGILINQI